MVDRFDPFVAGDLGHRGHGVDSHLGAEPIGEATKHYGCLVGTAEPAEQARHNRSAASGWAYRLEPSVPIGRIGPPLPGRALDEAIVGGENGIAPLVVAAGVAVSQAIGGRARVGLRAVH